LCQPRFFTFHSIRHHKPSSNPNIDLPESSS
jgi:hypothetical protein